MQLEYTSPCWSDGAGRTAGGLRYTTPSPSTTARPSSSSLAERLPVRTGDPVAPYVNRLAGLPPRTTADWSGHISGQATAYNLKLSDHRGKPELFLPTCFANDDGVEVPVLLNHDYDRHVGWATLEHRRDGLHFTGQLNKGGARRVGNWRGLSIGFGSASLIPGDSATRRHYSGQVYELSICERGAHHPHSYVEVLTPATLALAA